MESDIRKGIVEEIFRPARRIYPRMKIRVRGLYETLSADLVDMQKYSRQNKGFKYILTVLDNYSKFAWAVPVKNKSGPTVAAALESILNEGHPIRKIHTDEGKEFFNKHVRVLLKKHGVRLYHTYSGMKSPIVERFNRTLRHLMHPVFYLRGNVKWIDILPDLIDRYNSTRHRTIRMTPKEAANPSKKQLRILKKVYEKPRVVPGEKKPKFHVGDLVRVSVTKGVFEKGYTVNYSADVYRVAKVKLSNPRTYLLKDALSGEEVKGRFYEPELTKTRFPQYLIERVLARKGTKSRVKFVGYDKPEWIEEEDFV